MILSSPHHITSETTQSVASRRDWTIMLLQRIVWLYQNVLLLWHAIDPASMPMFALGVLSAFQFIMAPLSARESWFLTVIEFLVIMVYISQHAEGAYVLAAVTWPEVPLVALGRWEQRERTRRTMAKLAHTDVAGMNAETYDGSVIDGEFAVSLSLGYAVWLAYIALGILHVFVDVAAGMYAWSVVVMIEWLSTPVLKIVDLKYAFLSMVLIGAAWTIVGMYASPYMALIVPFSVPFGLLKGRTDERRRIMKLLDKRDTSCVADV